MLGKSDRPIIGVIQTFAKFGAEAAYLVPTETGMKKSIMDAHSSFREYFEKRNIHDYTKQSQGLSNKVLLNAWLIIGTKKIQTQISLYRPDSKTGDPRVWVYELKKYAKPHNLLAVIEHNGEIYVINTSNQSFDEAVNSPGSPLNTLLTSIAPTENPAATELLAKLREINQRGFIKSLRKGSTGIGMTLETSLGIPANSSKAPDYKGIEIKSSRIKKANPNCRVTLFGKVPEWTISNIDNATG